MHQPNLTASAVVPTTPPLSSPTVVSNGMSSTIPGVTLSTSLLPSSVAASALESATPTTVVSTVMSLTSHTIPDVTLITAYLSSTLAVSALESEKEKDSSLVL